MLFNKVENTYGNQKISDFDDGKDPLFPDNINCINSKSSDGYSFDYQNPKILDIAEDKIEFKSLEDVFGKFAFEDEIHSEKTEQGQLGDCYFIETLQSFSQFGKIIINRIRRIKEKLYEIIFIIDGIETKVIITDTMPFRKNTNILYFSTPIEIKEEFYLCLFEKAFAKICGGYSNIVGGGGAEIKKILVGYKSEIESLKDDINMIEIKNKIKKAKLDGNCLIKLSMNPSYKSGHALTLVDLNEKNIIIKDPHGKSFKKYESIFEQFSFDEDKKKEIRKRFEDNGLLELPVEILKKK